MPQSERERFRNDLLWANFVFGPFSCLLFGLGPGVMAWGWLQMFPESVIGDEELFGKRDPMPSPLSESLLADDSMSPAAEGANPSEQRIM